MNDNVVPLHRGLKVSRPVDLGMRQAYVPLTALLHAVLVYGHLRPDNEKLTAVKRLFAEGLLVNHELMTAVVPTHIADMIDEISPALYGQAAGAMQMISLTDCGATEACAAVTNKE